MLFTFDTEQFFYSHNFFPHLNSKINIFAGTRSFCVQ